MSAGQFGLRLAADHQAEMRRLALQGSSPTRGPGPERRRRRGPPSRPANLRRQFGHLLMRAGRWVAGPEDHLDPRPGGVASVS